MRHEAYIKSVAAEVWMSGSKVIYTEEAPQLKNDQ